MEKLVSGQKRRFKFVLFGFASGWEPLGVGVGDISVLREREKEESLDKKRGPLVEGGA